MTERDIQHSLHQKGSAMKPSSDELFLYEKVCAPRLEEIQRTLDRITHLLEGNGEAGLKVRVDRLEQREENRRWAIRVIWAAIIGIIVQIAWSVFRDLSK